jgi:hypothetical protein
MSALSRDETLSGVSYQTPRSAVQVAAIIQKSKRLAYINLNRLFALGLIQYEIGRSVNSIGKTYDTRLWTRIPDGSVLPLYPPTFGVDASTLASCWGGYTFLNKKDTGEKNGITEQG